MIDFPNVPDITGILINSEIHICKEITWDSEYKMLDCFQIRKKHGNTSHRKKYIHILVHLLKTIELKLRVIIL